MKKRDGFSRFEKGWHSIGAFLAFLVFPYLTIYLVDELFLKELSWFIRYPLWAVTGTFAIFFGLEVVSPVDKIFASIRKKFGMKPLQEIEDEIDNQRIAEEDAKERRFMGRPENEQGYILYLQQEQQLAQLSKIKARIEIVIALIIVLVWGYISRFF